MKNKEIEELLKNIKDKYSYEPYDNTGEVYTTISYEEGQLLLSYIEQLEKENETLGEIVNIKDEQLKEMQMQKTDYTAVNILEAKIEQLENNRDKAIEICDFYNKKYQKDPLGNQKVLFVISNVMNILKGGSDE